MAAEEGKLKHHNRRRAIPFLESGDVRQHCKLYGNQTFKTLPYGR